MTAFLARIPVPWDLNEPPKAQVTSGLTRSRWQSLNEPDRPQRRSFDGLFASSPHILILVKNPPVPAALRKLVLSDEEMPVRLDWAVARGQVRAMAPERARSSVSARYSSDAAYPSLSPQEWQEIEAIAAAEPPARRPDVSALPITTVDWSDLPPPRRRRLEKRLRDFETRQPAIVTKGVVMPASLTTRRAAWERMPPSLVKWAVQRGIREAEPPLPRRPEVHALVDRRQEIMLSLQRGEWCRVSDLDIFPWRLRQWLEDCDVEMIRYFGGGSISGRPANGYVTEDGTVFYVDESGADFYVQES